MEHADLIPPAQLLSDGTLEAEQFVDIGEGFTRHYLIGRARLEPTESVLDIGSGNGQKARPLASYLRAPGRYEGLDVVAENVRWCVNAYRRFPNFRFQLADVYSKHYNPSGRYRAHEYRLPYAEGSFDVVFLSSVFTHMLPRDVRNYSAEIARVLRPGGRSVITFFLLNSESRRRLAAGQGTIQLPYSYETEACRIASQEVPETSVGHDEEAVRTIHEAVGLSLAEISYGNWCGRRELVGAQQDVLIAVRERPSVAALATSPSPAP